MGLEGRSVTTVKITISVDSDNIIGVKETLVEYFEKFGDVRIVDVKEIGGEPVEQTKLWLLSGINSGEVILGLQNVVRRIYTDANC